MRPDHPATPADLLETILAAARRIVEVRSDRETQADLARRAEARPPRPGCFRAALARRDRVNIIAECKRRCPSRGGESDYDSVAIAQASPRGRSGYFRAPDRPFSTVARRPSGVREAVETPLC